MLDAYEIFVQSPDKESQQKASLIFIDKIWHAIDHIKKSLDMDTQTRFFFSYLTYAALRLCDMNDYRARINRIVGHFNDIGFEYTDMLSRFVIP